MPQVDFSGLAVLLTALGLFFFLAVRLALKAVPRFRQESRPAADLPGEDHLEDHGDAVLVVELGGRVKTINSRARQMFHLQVGDTPNLERLSRKVRPADSLLQLCVSEGRTRFLLDGRLVEAASYLVSTDHSRSAVVTLRYADQAGRFSGRNGSLNIQSLKTFTQLTQAMASSLDFDTTLQSVFVNVEKLLPVDFIEIFTWDPEGGVFIPYRYVEASGGERQLYRLEERFAADEGISAYLIKQQSPTIVADLETRKDLKALLAHTPFTLRSFLGLPLVAGKDAVGSLHLGSLAPDAFHEDDLDLVHLISGQAAAAIHNALLYRVEQKRTAELSGLAQMAQAFSSVRNPAVVFARLVESIVPLIPVEVLGYLIYNEARRTLDAQAPFHGLPDQIVALYSAPVEPGSQAEKILLDQDFLISENASVDEKWASLGLAYIAQAASLRETVLVPLTAGGHMLGYLQASNHTHGYMPFSQSELHLLLIIANQTASVIENATLIHQSRQRTQRAEALRRIASLASSVANLEEVLQFSVKELARLLHAEIGVVFLIDHGELKLRQPASFGSFSTLPDHLKCVQVEDPQFPFSVTGSQRALTCFGESSQEQALIPFYQEVMDHWQITSLIAVPLVARNQGIGELWFASSGAANFEQGDVQVVATAAGQLASVIEQWSLRGQTDEILRRQLAEASAAARISRELSTSLDLHTLANQVYENAVQIAQADCGSVVLFEQEKQVEAAHSVRLSAGEARPERLSEQEQQALATGEPVYIPEFQGGNDPAPHPGVRSLLIVPLLYQHRPVGMIVLHAKQAGRFDQDVQEMTRSLAFQAGIALQNAWEYEQRARQAGMLRRDVEMLSRLVDASRSMKPADTMEQSLLEVARAIQSATPFQAVVISVYDDELQAFKRIAGAGISPETWEALQSHHQPRQSLLQMLKPEYQRGAAYFLPEEAVSEFPADMHYVDMVPDPLKPSETAWRQRDMLLLPLFDRQANPAGIISVDAPADNCRPDQKTITALEFFASQASMIITSAVRVERLAGQVQELVQDRARLENSAEQSRRNLPILLHKELEQAIAIRGLNQRIERVQATLDLAALANRRRVPGEVLRTLAGGMLTRFAMQYALIAEKTTAGLRLVDTLGGFSTSVNPDALFGQRNPLRQLLLEQARVPEAGLLLISNLDHRSEWSNSPLLAALEARSLIGLQLEMGGGCLAGVLVIGQRSLPTFLEEDRRVFAQLAHQVSVGLQNLQLLKETRERLKEVDLLLDFSRKLGSLKPADILKALIENAVQVIPNAESGWVGIWDEKEQAILPQAVTGYILDEPVRQIRYSMQGSAGDGSTQGASLPLRVYRTGQPIRVSEVDFASQYRLGSDDLMRYRRATNARLPVAAMLVPMQAGESVLGVLFLENFDTPDAFSTEDEALASSFSRQASMALENARLFQASERRAAQLQALTAVASTITSSLQYEELVSSLLDHLKQILPYDTATLWLRGGNHLRVAAAAGFSDNDLRLNLSVAVEDSQLFGLMIQTSEPISVGDLRSDPRFPSLLEPEYLSWLGIPLIYQSEVAGLIALEKSEPDFYTQDYIQAGKAFASQAAVSLENARLYEESISRAVELNERSERLGLLNRLSAELVASMDMENIFRLAARQLLDALDAGGVAAVVIDPGGQYVLQLELPAREHTAPYLLPESELFDHLQATRGIFQTDHVADESSLQTLRDAFLQARDANSLLVVPLAAGAAIQGWFLVWRTQEYRYTLPEIELARTMCNQSAIAIHNARLFAETRRLTADLERRVEERTKELRREHQNSQTLLHIITELSASLDMDLVLSRTLAVLNTSLGCEESQIILSQSSGAFYQAGMQLSSLNRAEAGGSVLGRQNGGTVLERQIARWAVQARQPVVVGKIAEDGRWEIPPGSRPAYQSVMGVALVMGEDALGSLLLFHRAPDFFSKDQVKLLEAAARQIAIALNNAGLFNLIRDQSEHLGSLLRDQQIESSRSRAILEAVADGVLVTDANGRLTLVNISAERILSLTAARMMGKPLENFSGLFGRSAALWVETIQSWSKEPSAYQNVETYAEQIELDNGRIVAVHLAPVYWRQEFLGTVSIFRDITTEVQVDRLKSEFVANVSHELRTPLTSIKGYVEIMLMGATGSLDTQQSKFLHVVKSNTERLSVLVNDLLDISQIETGRINSTMQPVDLREIAAGVLDDLRARSKNEFKPMNFELLARPGLPFARGDRERVRQVIQALATNGYNYTPAGGQVEVFIHQEGEELQVDVKDNGIGIAPGAHHRIFERFYRGEDSLVLAAAGTGLGLAIARTLVEMHHGRIWFESSGVSGQGSQFSFTLPVSQVEEQAV